MTKTKSAAAKSSKTSAAEPATPRTPRSIRFSDSEWTGIEKEAKSRGMTAAELVRHAAVNAAAADFSTLAPEIATQVERIYRGVYLLATLQRDEMVRDGRQNELKNITNAANEALASVRAELEKRLQPRP